MEVINLRNSYALIPYVAVGVVAAVSVWAACSAYLGKRKTKRAAEDSQTVDQTIFRSEALEQFWTQRMLPVALAGDGMFKEHYIRGMLSTIQRIRADLLRLARQVQTGIPLAAAQREHLTFLRKELNRCMQRPDGQYFDLTATLAESDIDRRDNPKEARSHSQSRSPRGQPVVRNVAEPSRVRGTSVSSDEDWTNPLNPLNPFSPLNPLAATVSPWAFWKSEPAQQDESDRRRSSSSDSGGSSISSVFSPGGDDDIRRTATGCYTQRDTGDGGGSSGGGDGGGSSGGGDGGGGGNDGGGGGDCGGGGGGD
ncbi:hypothetical protein ACUXIL_003386 [Ralstonia pickettii]